MNTCQTCRTADNAITLCTGEIYCYDCGTWTQPAPVTPPDDAREILAAYITAREAWEGTRDDIAWGDFRTANDARAHLPAVTGTYHLARDAAAAAGVLAAGRALFR